VTQSEWEQGVPAVIKTDAVWKVTAYRLALFLSDLAWADATKLIGDRRTISLADQLYRAAGAISSDIAEGYSRSGGKDRARFYEYALGSTRESRDWYYKAREILGPDVAQHRLNLTTDIVRLLITMVDQQRTTATRLA